MREGGETAHRSSEIIFYLIFGELQISIINRLSEWNWRDHAGVCF